MYLDDYRAPWGEVTINPWHLLSNVLARDGFFNGCVLVPMNRSRMDLAPVRTRLGLPAVSSCQYLTSSSLSIPARVDADKDDHYASLALSSAALKDLKQLAMVGDECLADPLLRANDGFRKLADGVPLDQFHFIFGMQDEAKIRRTNSGRSMDPSSLVLYLRVDFALLPRS